MNPKSIRIATFNINGLPTFAHMPGAKETLLPYSARHKAICDWFEQSDIDVINFQEIFTYRNLRLLKNRLPSYKFVAYKPFIFGPKGALVIFSKQPLTVTGYSSFLSSIEEVTKAQIPKLNILRAALKGILMARLDSVPVNLVNTHLLYSGRDLTKADRFNAIHQVQMNLLAAKVKMQMDPDKKIVVAGDFNIEIGEMTRSFIAKCQLYDLFDGDDGPSFHNEFLGDIKTTARIDFLLTNDPASGPSADRQRIFTDRFNLKRRKVFLSDHEGLVATVNAT